MRNSQMKGTPKLKGQEHLPEIHSSEPVVASSDFPGVSLCIPISFSRLQKGPAERGHVKNRQKPRGPKDQKISRFRARLKTSSENDIFERATHRGPIFCREFETSRLKFSSEIEIFERHSKIV